MSIDTEWVLQSRWKPPAILGTLIKDLAVSCSGMECESTERHYSLGGWEGST